MHVWHRGSSLYEKSSVKIVFQLLFTILKKYLLCVNVRQAGGENMVQNGASPIFTQTKTYWMANHKLLCISQFLYIFFHLDEFWQT
jgi:hypothetical protein